jgi:hypothetical protein
MVKNKVGVLVFLDALNFSSSLIFRRIVRHCALPRQTKSAIPCIVDTAILKSLWTQKLGFVSAQLAKLSTNKCYGLTSCRTAWPIITQARFTCDFSSSNLKREIPIRDQQSLEGVLEGWRLVRKVSELRGYRYQVTPKDAVDNAPPHILKVLLL